MCAQAGVRAVGALMRLRASSVCVLGRAKVRERFGRCLHFGESPEVAFCVSIVKLGLI